MGELFEPAVAGSAFASRKAVAAPPLAFGLGQAIAGVYMIPLPRPARGAR
ncbi:hypothetical protein WMF30_24800 [Sorangium sp. So ce134]